MNSQYIAILGRQPKLGLAELERRYGEGTLTPISEFAALLQTADLVDIDYLGGSVKIAKVVETTNGSAWLGTSKKAVQYVVREFTHEQAKITLGFSAYGFGVSERDVQKTGLIIKRKLRESGGSVRLIPNTEPALSSAQVFHNKLAHGTTKREIILVSGSDGHGYIAETIGVQDIDAYTLRDRGRPKRDPLNGMLPPKLAQIMVNVGVGTPPHEGEPAVGHTPHILDPFCGTGVVLQEALLMGYEASGSDVNPKMVDYSATNLQWLRNHFGDKGVQMALRQADATTHQWPELREEISAIVSETYLGEPMAQAPQAEKLARVTEKCEEIIRSFLSNAASQAPSGLTLCIAVPAWRIGGEIKHLPVVDDLAKLGYNWIDFKHVNREDLLYYREDQVVARELLVITKG